jgi:ADP-ribosylglycohydrolase
MSSDIHVNCAMCTALSQGACAWHQLEIENPAFMICAHFRPVAGDEEASPPVAEGLSELSHDWLYDVDPEGETSPRLQLVRKRRKRVPTGMLNHLPEMPDGHVHLEKQLIGDRISGCLLGLALGEALGFPAEGRSPQDIEMIYGGPLKGLVPRQGRHHSWPLAQIARETQLTQILAHSLLAGRGHLEMDDFAERLVRWLPSALKPGKSTLKAVQALVDGQHWSVSGLDSNGSGGTARVASLALLRRGQFGRLRQEAILQCSMTHKGSKALAGTTLFATAIAALSDTPSGGLERPVFLRLLEQAIRGIDYESSARLAELNGLLDSAIPTREVLQRFKTGGYILECLPSALYCFLRWPNEPLRALLTAINAGFDACTTGAMTGALSGAYLGLSGLPNDLIEKLPVLDALKDLANDLTACSAETSQ